MAACHLPVGNYMLPILLSITVAPASVYVGTTEQMTATGNYSDGTTSDLTGLAVWASSVTANATSTVGGAVTGVKASSTNLTATYGGKTGTLDATMTWGILDETGNGNHASRNVGMLILDTMGAVDGYALQSESETWGGQVPNVAAFQPAYNEAWSANIWWMGPLPVQGALFSSCALGGLHGVELINSGGNLIVQMNAAGGLGGAIFAEKASPVFGGGTWHNITVTYDGTGSGTGFAIYVDGGALGGLTTGGTLTSTPTYANGMRFLARGNGDIPCPANSQIDTFSFWKGRKLSAAEVADIYALQTADDIRANYIVNMSAMYGFEDLVTTGWFEDHFSDAALDPYFSADTGFGATIVETTSLTVTQPGYSLSALTVASSFLRTDVRSWEIDYDNYNTPTYPTMLVTCRQSAALPGVDVGGWAGKFEWFISYWPAANQWYGYYSNLANAATGWPMVYATNGLTSKFRLRIEMNGTQVRWLIYNGTDFATLKAKSAWLNWSSIYPSVNPPWLTLSDWGGSPADATSYNITRFADG